MINTNLSAFLAIKGLFVEPTYRAFRGWDLDQSAKSNLAMIKETNSIGAPSVGWLGQFVKATTRRYDLEGVDRVLIEIVQKGWHIDDWRPLLLWHGSRTDALLQQFLANWLFERRQEGVVAITVESVCDFINTVLASADIDGWNDTTINRAAAGLLRTAVDFHLMRGRSFKQFESYRLPEPSFLYLLHVLMEREKNTRRMVHADDWKLFLIEPHDVEEELLRLHQFGKLHFERAGSFLELTLPCNNTADYLRSVAG